jgi:hypothetical protein
MPVVTDKSRDLLGAVLELDATERAWFAREVIASLDGEEASAQVEAAWATEIRRRLSEIESGKVALEDWSVTRERLLNR